MLTDLKRIMILDTLLLYFRKPH